MAWPGGSSRAAPGGRSRRSPRRHRPRPTERGNRSGCQRHLGGEGSAVPRRPRAPAAVPGPPSVSRQCLPQLSPRFSSKCLPRGAHAECPSSVRQVVPQVSPKVSPVRSRGVGVGGHDRRCLTARRLGGACAGARPLLPDGIGARRARPLVAGCLVVAAWRCGLAANELANARLEAPWRTPL
jgi:hypothetical protein